jgi:hypothetical protein
MIEKAIVILFEFLMFGVMAGTVYYLESSIIDPIARAGIGVGAILGTAMFGLIIYDVARTK